MGTRIVEIAGLSMLYEFPENMSCGLPGDFAGSDGGRADIRVRVTECDVILHLSGSPFFERELNWYAIDMGYAIERPDPENGHILSRMLVNREWTCAEILVIKDHDKAAWDIECLFLEILFRSRIIRNSGLVVHGSAILADGRAIMFSAPSGTGKSTQAGLWARHKGALHINDDHPAVVIQEGKAVVYGTPWAGSRNKYANISAPLSAVVILEQAKVNAVKRLTPQEAIPAFLPRCFLPYFDEAQMELAVDTFNRITGSVPVFRLECRPDREAVELLSDVLAKEFNK